MDYKEVLREKNIALLWLPQGYSEHGTHIAPCYHFPNGAACLTLGMPEEAEAPAAFHEIGHIEEGIPLALCDDRIRELKHCKNEANANRYLLHKFAPEFVDANGNNPQYATPQRLCAYLEIENSCENIQIAKEEINQAFRDAM